MQRRDFITFIGGATAAAAWPVVVRAQQADRVRRIAVIIALPENDPELKKWLAAFRQGLEKTDGRNVSVDYRFTPAGAQATALAKELLARRPDVILAHSTPITAALQRESRAAD